MCENFRSMLRDMIRQDAWRMDCLRGVRKLNLPDSWIGAGFVRARVWDVLSGFESPTPLDDVDVLYYNDSNLSKEIEKLYEARLHDIMPGVKWSVKNQARMHLTYNPDQPPYQDTEDGLRHWLETPTAIAVRLNANDDIDILAPYGLDDLFALRLAPTPHAQACRPENYVARVTKKPWREQWPRLEVIWPEESKRHA